MKLGGILMFNKCGNGVFDDWLIWIILIVVIFCFCGNGNGRDICDRDRG